FLDIIIVVGLIPEKILPIFLIPINILTSIKTLRQYGRQTQLPRHERRRIEPTLAVHAPVAAAIWVLQIDKNLFGSRCGRWGTNPFIIDTLNESITDLPPEGYAMLDANFPN
ncbi:hypothetical protein E4U52_006058, partial [Claviceps spartinae]